MDKNSSKLVIDLFDEENIRKYLSQQELVKYKQGKVNELNKLGLELNDAFKVNLNTSDIIVSAAAGILLGLGNALFKTVIPKSGKLSHKHGVTRTAVDYKVKKPAGYKGSVQDLHRQIGPGHDVFRFKEALELMSGKSKDFPLWGKNGF